MAIHIRKTWHSHASRNPRQGRTGSGRAEGRAGGRATGGPPQARKKGAKFPSLGGRAGGQHEGGGPQGGGQGGMCASN